MPESELVYVAAETGFGCPSDNAGLDVVFVHGLGGDRFGTWQDGPGSEGYWLRWLAADFPTINVWTAGYDSAVFAGALIGEGPGIADRSTILLDFLLSKNIGTRGVIFITHSLGGLIVKQMLRKCADAYNQDHTRFLNLVRGVVFIATPHQGSSGAAALNFVLRRVLSKNTKELVYGEAALVDLYAWFRNWVGKSGISVAAYHETLKTDGVMVVDTVTANPGVLGCELVAVQADHFSICKPLSRQSQIYISVNSFIQKRLSNPAQGEGSGPAGISQVAGGAGYSQTTPPQQDAAFQEDQSEFTTKVLDGELLIDYQNFTAKAEGDRRTLEQKLIDGCRTHEVKDAEKAKERFAMTLRRHIAQAAPLGRYTRMMAQVEGRFRRHVRPALLSKTPMGDVNQLVQQSVIDPVVKCHTDEGAGVTDGTVEGALYYLTGNCHIEWDNGQD